MVGYTLALVKAVRQASRHKIGVQLGMACIRKGIPVTQVAQEFNVTRPTIYSWFTGKSNPNWRQEEAIQKYLNKLA